MAAQKNAELIHAKLPELADHIVVYEGTGAWSGGRNGTTQAIGLYVQALLTHSNTPTPWLQLGTITSKGEVAVGANVGIPLQDVPAVIELLLGTYLTVTKPPTEETNGT